MTKIHLQNKWAETNNSVCALLRQAHDVLALTSLPVEQVRKPLTQKQIKKIYYSVTLNTGNFWWDFARAVEQAHGIGVENEPDQRST